MNSFRLSLIIFSIHDLESYSELRLRCPTNFNLSRTSAIDYWQEGGDKLKFVGGFLGAFLLTFQVVSIGRTRLRPGGVRPVTPHAVGAAKNFHIKLMLTPMRGLRAWPFGSTL